MGTLRQDLHYASRLLVRTPGLTAMAVVALALGIGANTAIFSIVNAVLLQPLPFPDPERLVLIWGGRPDQGIEQLPISYPYVTDWKEQTRSFDALGTYFSYSNTAVNLTGAGAPERVQGVYAAADLFHVLGVRPLHGRTFLAEEDVAGSAPVVVVGHALWKRRLGADPSVIGKAISLDGQPRTVVGVMPAGFSFPRYPRDAELWLPLSQDPSAGRQRSRGTNYLTVVARLKPDVTLQQVQDEMAAVGRRMEQEHPQFKAGHHVTVVPLHQQVVRELRPALVVLLGAVGFVLLIACADVANLLLARAASRGKEIAVRAALGASHWRLTRQLLTESMLLSLLGGAAGVFLALWAIDLFSFIPYNAPGFLTPWGVTAADVRVDPSVLLFTLGLSALTGILFGLAPALHVARLDLRESLSEEWMRSTAGLRGRRLGAALVVAEIALSLMLLIGATLMARSLARLQNVALGFDPAALLTLELNLPRERYPQGAQVTAYYDSVLERLESIPGVIAAGAANILPLSGADESTGFFIEGQLAPPAGEVPHVHPRRISPDYFRVMGTPFRGGRPFSDQDRDGGTRVAIINETMARPFFSDRDPIGRRLALDYETMRFFPDKAAPEGL